MKRSSNRGVSLIEILIAVVVFVICVVPIITQLVAGIRLGQKADDQQAATDYGKSISETIKQVDLDELVDLGKGYVNKDDLAKLLELSGEAAQPDKIKVTCMFYSIDKGSISKVGDSYVVNNKESLALEIPYGSYVKNDGTAPANYKLETVEGGAQYSSVTEMYQKLELLNRGLDDDHKQALVREYKITCSHSLNARNYDVELVLDNLPYAASSLVKTDYIDPNQVNLGNLSNFDSSTTAVIVSASNYDSIATSALIADVLQAMERTGDPNATRLKENNSTVVQDIMSSDKRPKKTTTITISKAGTGDRPYTVDCTIKYEDIYFSSVTDSSGNQIYPISNPVLEYPAYSQKFKEMPDVYLLYNQYVYRDTYADDTIIIDNQINSSIPARVYVVRTADDATDINGNIVANAIQESQAYNPTTGTMGKGYDRDYKSSTGYFYRTMFQLTKSVATNPVEIYTNIIRTGDANATKLNYTTYDATEEHYSQVNNSESDRSTKISVKTNTSDTGDAWKKVVKLLSDDERYSDSGRLYDVNLTLKNTISDTITSYSSSKGDY